MTMRTYFYFYAEKLITTYHLIVGWLNKKHIRHLLYAPRHRSHNKSGILSTITDERRGVKRDLKLNQNIRISQKILFNFLTKLDLKDARRMNVIERLPKEQTDL